MRKKVLVTGGGGFIGSHLVELLVSVDYNVTAFVHYNSRNHWGMLEDLDFKLLSAVEIISGDLRDYETVERAVRNCEYVFHLGALIGIPYSYLSPIDVVSTNVLGTVNVLNACRKNDALIRMVHTSTSEVYGTARYTPIDEKHPLQAQSPYAATKIAADKLVESFYLSYGLPVVSIRPFNTFGPRQSTRAIIPTIITQVLSRNTLDLGDVSTKRDFTFVKDTANAFLKAAIADEVEGKVLNIGNGKNITIEELCKYVAQILEKDIIIERDENRLRPKGSEVEELLCNSELANKLLDWKPKFKFEEGLKLTAEWLEENIKKMRAGTYTI